MNPSFPFMHKVPPRPPPRAVVQAALGAVTGTALAILLGAAHAATQVPTTANFAVSATVAAGCWVVGSPSQTTGVGFGMLNFGTHPALAVGTFSTSVNMSSGSPAQVQCTPGTSATMTLNGGLNAVGNQRRMKSGTSYLAYTLTTAAGGGTVVLPGAAVGVNASAGAITLPVFGAVTMPVGGLPAGSYVDTVQVVFSW